MGTSYANQFIGFIEHHFFSQYNRYIDDFIGTTATLPERSCDDKFSPANWKTGGLTLRGRDNNNWGK